MPDNPPAAAPTHRHRDADAPQLRLRGVHARDLAAEPHQLLRQDARARRVALLGRRFDVLSREVQMQAERSIFARAAAGSTPGRTTLLLRPASKARHHHGGHSPTASPAGILERPLRMASLPTRRRANDSPTSPLAARPP